MKCHTRSASPAVVVLSKDTEVTSSGVLVAKSSGSVIGGCSPPGAVCKSLALIACPQRPPDPPRPCTFQQRLTALRLLRVRHSARSAGALPLGCNETA